MTEQEKAAMLEAWRDWHSGIDDCMVPSVNTSFARGFDAGLKKVNSETLHLLETMVSAYEDGPDCYEDPEECSVHIGKAIRLDNDTYSRIADILNGRPPIDTRMEAAIAKAVAAEREACAALCVDQAERLDGPSDARGIAYQLAGQIRSRTK